MSWFGRIRDAIVGKAKAQPQAQTQPRAGQQPTPQQQSPQAQATKPQVAPAAVDVEQVLTELAADHSEKLNWRSSIVDLMKLLALDSSLANRKELADELGYSGAKDGSAEMNIWLHKAVMRKLAENGARVPAELTD